MNNFAKTAFLWIIILVVIIAVFSNFGQQEPNVTQYTYSEFLSSVKAGNISNVDIENNNITGKTKAGKAFETYLPMMDQNLLSELIKQNITVQGVPPKQRSLLMQILINWAPFLLLIAVWVFFMRQMQGGGKGGPMSFGRSKARLLGMDQVHVTFKDVAGIDEAKAELEEMVEFLRDPGKFQSLGGKMPCGVLLVGSPGTGKTLLAKAVAGEAKVPFFTISGSDFVEMFVGVGASRVRDMFDQAKKHAPCIIFIDEIDAVGRHRGAGLGGGVGGRPCQGRKRQIDAKSKGGGGKAGKQGGKGKAFHGLS